MLRIGDEAPETEQGRTSRRHAERMRARIAICLGCVLLTGGLTNAVATTALPLATAEPITIAEDVATEHADHKRQAVDSRLAHPTPTKTQAAKENAKRSKAPKDTAKTQGDGKVADGVTDDVEDRDEVPQTQVIEVESADTDRQDPIASFWPKVDHFATNAHDDGSVVEWAPGFYIAHNWSDGGQAILSADIGQTIEVYGTPITICERFRVANDSTYEALRTEAGPWRAIFQTCSGQGDTLILFGEGDIGPFEIEGPYAEWQESQQQQTDTETVVYETVTTYEVTYDQTTYEPIALEYEGAADGTGEALCEELVMYGEPDVPTIG